MTGAATATGLGEMRRLLVCARWGIGDLVMALPLLHGLRRAAPQAHVVALAAEPAAEVLEGENVVDEVVSVQRLGYRHWGDSGSEATRHGTARWAAAGSFECILDGSHAPLGARMALSGLGLPWRDTGPYTLAPDAAAARPVVPVERSATAAGMAAGPRLLAAAARACWGVNVADPRPRLRLRSHEQAAARTYRRHLAGQGPVVGLVPQASAPLKRGSTREFARAADVLIRRHGGRALLFGAPGGDEAREVRELMGERSRGHLVQGGHLRRVAALLQQCDVLICNDTGLSHLGAAVGVPVVTVFACTSPDLYLPPGGTAVWRWEEPCRHLEAEQGRFGVTPCVAAGRCLEANHQRVERWADAAAAAASAALRQSLTGSAAQR